MSARGRPTPPGTMRHGPPPGPGGHRLLEHLSPELAKNEVIAQVQEIDHLITENRRLATSQGAMRHDLDGAQAEIQKLRAHIRSTQTESDIQIRMLLDKIGQMEADIRAGDIVKKDFQQAHIEAQALVAARQELVKKLQNADQELEKCQFDAKSIPDLLSELDSMRLEHQRLRSSFEHEKGANLDLVEHLQAMERNLVGMGKEVERLRADVLNAEKRLQAPYPPPIQSNGPYSYPYGRAHDQGMVPHGNTNGPNPAVVSMSGPSSSGAMAPTAWGVAYDANNTRK